MKQSGEKTRERLLNEAMLLFATRPYAEVTLRDIEKATGLSRGAVMYHITNKETLFREAVEMFVFKQNTLTSLAEDDNRTLKDTIREFITVLGKEQQRWKGLGIKNLNFSLVNVQMSCYNILKDSLKHAGEWYESECSIWKTVIERGIATGEIREVDSDLMARTIENLYLGAAYAGMPCPEGYNLENVEQQLMFIYNSVKKG